MTAIAAAHALESPRSAGGSKRYGSAWAARSPAGRRVYTARLTKGGALLHEMRTLVLVWDDSVECAERIVHENLLAHRSRVRSRDVIAQLFVPRFVRSTPPGLFRPLAVFEHASWPLRALLPIHFYAAAFADPLIWDFVDQVVVMHHARGLLEIGVDDVMRFLDNAPAERFPAGCWSMAVRLKVARNLLAALRDFGILKGAAKKRIAPVYLPVESFAFLALARRLAGVTASEAVGDPVWRLFELGDEAVEHCFVEAHQRGLLGYHAAGSVRRIDFPAENLVDYAHILARRPR